MRGLPVLIFIGVIIINVLVRVVKASQESQKNNNWDTDDNDEWTDWKDKKQPRAGAVPPPRPTPRPASRQVATRTSGPSTTSRPAVARNAPGSVRSKLEQVLREVQQAVEQPQHPTAPRPAAVPAAPPPPPPEPMRRVSEDAEALMPAPDDYKPLEQQEERVFPPGQKAVAAESISFAFPDATGNNPRSASRRPILLKIKGRSDLRRAVLVREVLERPRAFDM